ncbi:hypothetical protein AAU57_09345 [Nonlabens sp. YIK11]|uniref:type I restriction enzyme HsdR N-terminal domain-containing protein n=1 Tax=Nonlabens sp. YIK11 TaxID=1453349 RepID=UPI0006DC7843|nr:type I restriction enzyme HsdR N-terminal domain-containing protein [Nonlabens sp. YIK11]KQC33495.1 hypothetical protein AAU57_09345 [Nonlabens sp. YIK11]
MLDRYLQAENNQPHMKRYIKNGKECILCSKRKKLIHITPEEVIRQEFVSKLVNQFEVPIEFIDVEVPLSYYQKGKRGRADIIVSGIDPKLNERIPLMVIECKAPTIALTDKVFDQVMSYDEFLEPEVMIMTNGKETISHSWDDEKGDYREIKEIPIYSYLIKGNGIEFAKEFINNWERPNHKAEKKKNRELLWADGNIGQDTDIKYVPILVNLVGLIYDEKKKTENLELTEKTFVSDGGLRFTTFGNASGGGFTGDYRYFIVENENQETELVSISIMGKISTKNHPKYGNSNGHTLLNIAIDDFENSHLSLEYAIDRFVKVENEKYSFWHDGTLTVGKLGRVKNIDVIDFIKVNCPHLIRDNKIYLGTVDNSETFTWESENVRKLIANLIDYGFVRDKFRQVRKMAST